MFEAARLHDEIAHTSALAGFLAGAALGLALVVAVAFATATCGLGVVLIAGLLAGVGGMALTAWGEDKGKERKTSSGGIETGSPNVFINGLKAAQVEASEANCKKHPNPRPLVAEGSAKVFYNGLPAARKGDKLTCGGVIDSGSQNTFVGAESEQYLEIQDEVPEWLRTTVDILMALAGSAVGIAKLALMAGKSGLKVFTPCALKFAAAFAAGEVAGRFVVGPAISRAFGGLFGNPVDAVSGRKLLLEDSETDFTLPGLMPVVWSRFYASDLHHEGLLGRGWVLPWEQSLRLEGEQLLLRDNQGRELPLPTLAPGERLYLTDQQFFLVCTEGGHYLLQTLDNHFFYFGEVPADGDPAPLRRVENALGHFLNFCYDRQQRLNDICATGGIRLHLCYDHRDDRLSRVERVVANSPVETLVHYRYDGHGQLAQVTDRNGAHIRRFTYQQGVMTAHENALGLTCEYRWATFSDGVLRVAEHWTSDGERYRFFYDLEQRETTIVDALGRRAKVHYNAQHRVIASHDFGGEHYQIELDDTDNMTGVTLPDGNTLTLAYDDLSRLVEETDPLGRTTRYAYHLDTSLLTAIERPDGSREQWVYDRSGILLESIDPLGQTTRYLNTDDGLPHTRYDPQGTITHLTWSALGQVLQHQDCSGQRTRYDYDERLHLVGITDALEQAQRLIRQPSGEILRIEQPDGSCDAYGYNALGQLTSHTNGDGRTSYLERTARGLPKRRKDARGQQVHYHYDDAQRLVRLVNENQAAYRFSYDASDRLQEEVRVDGLRLRYRYSVSGTLAEVEEVAEQGLQAVSRSQQFEHDACGRLLSRITADSHLAYHYDEADRLTAIERLPSVAGKALGIEPERLAFAYDASGRLTEEHSAQGLLGYQYDALGNLTTLALPDGRQLNQLYYGSGHLHQINLDGLLVSDFERDALHRETLRSQGALTSRFGYDASGRKQWQAAIRLPHEALAQLQEQGSRLLGSPEQPCTLIHRRYQYSPGGELKLTADNHRGMTHYGYDAVGQLHSREPRHPQLQAEDFRYDAAGNLCGTGAWHFEAQPNNRLKAWGDLRFSYDAWGNLSEKSNSSGAYQRYHYDSENRLIRAETWHGAQRHSEAHYRYDSLGRRTGKEVVQNGQRECTAFLWQGLRLLQEQQPQLRSLYLYEPDSYAPLARIDSDPAQPERAGKCYYFHTDQIGTPQELTDAEGQVVWRAYYKAWGGLEALSPNRVEQNLRFQGQYHDRETGLHYNTFRYYDPGVGRFTAQDPIGLAGGLNLYAYAPSPLSWIDPLGLTCAPTKASSLPVTRPGTKMWSTAVEKLRAATGHATNSVGGNVHNIRVPSQRDAKRLIEEAFGSGFPRNKPQSRTGNYGYEYHRPPESTVPFNNDLQHIKWYNWRTKQGADGHVFFDVWS